MLSDSSGKTVRVLPSEQDPMGVIARFIADTTYESLPSEVIEKAKLRLLDVVACTLAGSSSDGSMEIVDLVTEEGGKKEATIPVFGGKVPASAAAFAIGYMARARDFVCA